MTIKALLIWNLVVFLIYGWDKFCAKTGAWRIPEKTLLLCAALFGSLGAIFGVHLLRHKTQHKSFTLTIPFMLVIHLALLRYFHII